MSAYRIAVITGDGIGPEIIEATKKVLHAVQEKFKIKLDMVDVEAGDDCLKKYSTPLPAKTIETIRGSDACLKAPVGETGKDVIVHLRQLLDLYANIRPIRCYPGSRCLRDDVDLIIVRENTEDLYKGIEFEIDGGAVAIRVITRNACRRIAEFAFNLASTRRRKVTAVHKSNVLRLSDGLFSQVCRDVAKGYPDYIYNELYVDAAAAHLIRNPQEFDVIVTTNLFGDILSDEAAQVVGGLGMAPSANIGDRLALFEPAHGSAPDIAGKGIANPCAIILSSRMMFEWLAAKRKDERCASAAQAIEASVREVLSLGVKTPELGGSSGTLEMGTTIAEHIMSG